VASDPPKGMSPFYPGQPVPVELFIGRQEEINRINRALSQVALGKPGAVFITGEYGIGKSSLAGFVRYLAEKEHRVFGIHVLLGGAATIEDVATKTVEVLLRSGAYEPSWTETVRNSLAKYIGKQDLFGFSVNLESLQADGPTLSHGFLPLLKGVFERVEKQGAKGILRILDEINGITADPKFSHFIKGLVDENALSRPPVPLLIMLCGVDDRRRDMIRHHPPIERIFDIAEMRPMDDGEMGAFFTRAFESQRITIDPDALGILKHYSAGYPKVMHIIGDSAFWIDKDGHVDKDDALSAVLAAAEDVGRKFVDQQVLRELRSQHYRSILSKLAKKDFDLSFQKAQMADGLTDAEKKKFNNFLQKMKRLNVLRAGDEMGEYIFTSRLVRLYILLNSAAISPGNRNDTKE
jgi:AAA ATPase domain